MDNLVYILLTVFAFIGGAMAVFVPQQSVERHRFWQVFSGAFLFAMTVAHLLPELFAMVFGKHGYKPSGVDLHLVGIFILLGYFMQSIIETVSKGVEHGHLHTHDHDAHVGSPLLLTVSLFVHGLLDGAVLINSHGGEHGNALLAGILIHKLPVAFVLMYQLSHALKSKSIAWVYFTLFAISSPIGLFVGESFFENGGWIYTASVYGFAMITGNFLNITTTIFVESNMGHKLFSKNRIALISGVLIALGLELLEVH